MEQFTYRVGSILSVPSTVLGVYPIQHLGVVIEFDKYRQPLIAHNAKR
jgi:hypothetical protein